MEAETSPGGASLKFWRWRIFAATYLSYAGYYFCRKPFYIVKADLGTTLHFDATQLGHIGAVYLTAYAVGQFVSGWAGTGWGPRLLLLVGMAGSIGANVVFGFANSYATFIGFMAFNGLAQAAGWSGNVGTMASWFHRGERGTVMGMWATNFQVGGVLANALAAWALGQWNYRYSFFAGAVVLTVVWAFFLLNQRNRPEDVGLPPVEEPEATAPATPDEAARWTRSMITSVLLVGVFYFFLKFVRYALWSWVPFFLSQKFLLKGKDAGYISTIFDIAGVLGVIVVGFASDRFFRGRRAQISLYSLVAMSGACLLLYTGGRSSLFLFTLSIGLIGFTLYGPDALMTGAGAVDVGNRRGATLAAGIINGMGSIGAVVQELVIGGMYHKDSKNLAPIFLLLLASAVMSTLMMSVIVVRNRMKLSDL